MQRMSVVSCIMSILSLFLIMCVACRPEYESSLLDAKAQKAYNILKFKVDNYRSKLVNELESVVLKGPLLFNDQSYSLVLLQAEEDATKRSIAVTLGNDSKVIERLKEILNTLDLRKGKSSTSDVDIAGRILKQLTDVTNLAVILFHKHLSKKNLIRIRNSLMIEVGSVSVLDDITSDLEQFIQARVEVMSKIRSFIKTAAAKRGDKAVMINCLKSLIDDAGELSKEILARLVGNVFNIENKLIDLFKWDS
ncbi:Hypothetical protein BHO_0024000 (plasmid) [Borrelia hermsii YBT]|uniref:hypothetical protein n=1 Tax=Borrelia hermsii TaxID=140 RepID=UPI0003E32EA3|nr:hypothetical protein [Borrelia hermsii]AHH13005.1 Hypothetical protein BHO_0024000 [Borrelia hermsii YBT]